VFRASSCPSGIVLCELNSAVAHVVDGTLVQYSTILRTPGSRHMGLWRWHLNRRDWQDLGKYQVCKLGLQNTETSQLGHNTVYMCVAESNPPNLQDVFMMYCNMTHGTTFRDLCIRFNPQARRIDERKLVQFGLLHKLIRRVHKVMTLWINSASNLHINWHYTWWVIKLLSVFNYCRYWFLEIELSILYFITAHVAIGIY
jgi:hypothetical protein